MSNKKYSKYGSNGIKKYCNDLIADFFSFCDGHPESITTMVWINDIKEPTPPTPKQMGTLLARLDVIWKKFCKDAKLPREMYGLLIERVKKQWLTLEQKTEIPIRKRKNVTENPH